MSQPEQNQTSGQKGHQQGKIKRVKNHEAVLKVKQIQDQLQMMKRRHKYLQVRDQLNRSLTIQHQRKLQQHQSRRQQAKKDRSTLDKYSRDRMLEIQNTKQKNQNMKQEIQKNIAKINQKIYSDRVEGYQTMKVQRTKNQQLKKQIKNQDLKQKQQKRDNIAQMKQMSKINLSRYKQNKSREAEQYKSLQYDAYISRATNKQKQLQKLSKMQEQMIKKHSQSMQVSQAMRNRLRQVLGDQRRFTKLPSIKSGNPSSARGSTGHTQVILL